eukprot:CAMPEP_0113683984 /NCGR_PEP_ID=MMETSP0038_2-20120614/13690_1 /TAXON_ID=2898 /ORGANISM="Cryptomonas paramecium" /LENGTH=121 /DNA_ID=CAMNT_0000603561 /DNA_START=61 /DNA_END=424 /DNA_ORIENTATION=+ /assembly_acc=CAM_ASM_000170
MKAPRHCACKLEADEDGGKRGGGGGHSMEQARDDKVQRHGVADEEDDQRPASADPPIRHIPCKPQQPLLDTARLDKQTLCAPGSVHPTLETQIRRLDPFQSASAAPALTAAEAEPPPPPPP